MDRECRRLPGWYVPFLNASNTFAYCRIEIVALVSPAAGGSKDWKIEVLTTAQNGDNDAEIERVQREHPGETECVQDRRVLGALAPFRSM